MDKSEFLELDENNLQARFTGRYRLGRPPIVYTEFPFLANSCKGRFAMKMLILNGGKDNAIAIDLTVKNCDTLNTNTNNFYMYKYHGRNGYIYSQTEAANHFTEKIIRAEKYGSLDIITLCLNFAASTATFIRNGKKAGDVCISKYAMMQKLFPFIALNAPVAVVRAAFLVDGKAKL